MDLSISNLAWDINDDNQILPLLVSNNVLNIEGVLTKLGDWDVLTDEVLTNYKKKLDLIGLNIPSIQSIFYNVKSNGIGDKLIFYTHVKKLIHICKILGIKIMVFGSPSMRKNVDNLTLSEIFIQVDQLLEGTNIILTIEPNSKVYGGEFFHNLNEIVNFIVKNNLKNIKTMVDTHNLILEGLNPSTEYINHKKYINHIHISEIGLTSIEKTETHLNFYKTLKNNKYRGIITYEVNNSLDINKDINTFIDIYGAK